MPFPADGVDVLTGMAERARQKGASGADDRGIRSSKDEGSWLGTLGALLLLAILLFILVATGSHP
jgi:hypothetical protein